MSAVAIPSEKQVECTLLFEPQLQDPTRIVALCIKCVNHFITPIPLDQRPVTIKLQPSLCDQVKIAFQLQKADDNIINQEFCLFDDESTKKLALEQKSSVTLCEQSTTILVIGKHGERNKMTIAAFRLRK